MAAIFRYLVPSPTPAGCHPVTPPPGSFGATECNFDGAFASLDNIFRAFDFFVLVPIALVLVAAGVFALATAKGPLPHAIARALPREPASSRDRRLQGLSLTLGGLGVLIGTAFVSRVISQPSSPPPPHPDPVGLAIAVVVLALFVAGLLAMMTVRQRDHRTSEVLNGWEQIAKTLRG